jgi:ankyrin repeat protein
LEDIPLKRVVEYLDNGEVYPLALTCSSSLAAVQAVHGGVVPSMEPRFLKLAISSGQLEMVKWMHAQCPLCPCDFRACRELAEEGGAVRAYLQMILDLLRMCKTRTMPATETADAVGLIDQWADQHAKDDYGSTPLHWTCMEGHAEVVKALLEKGVDLHAKDIDGSMPLHNACYNGHADVVKTLLEKGADVHAKNSLGQTPLYIACLKGNADVVKTLLEKGADVHAKNIGGSTPLYSACLKGNAEVVKTLLEKGADVHAMDSDGETPLYSACLNGHHDIAAMLRAKGAVD